MPGGRPSKYTPELLEKAYAYFDDYNHYNAVFPSHTGLALYLDVRTETLYTWRKEEGKEEFSDILDKILEIQHEMLIGGGITNEYNSNITKLVLGKHGYKDQQESTGSFNVNIPTDDAETL